MFGLILLLVVVILILGTYPSWPYSKAWGYRPSAGLSFLLLILILLILIGYIPFIGIKKPILVLPTSSKNVNNDKANVVIVPEKTSNNIITPETKSILTPENTNPAEKK